MLCKFSPERPTQPGYYIAKVFGRPRHVFLVCVDEHCVTPALPKHLLPKWFDCQFLLYGPMVSL